MRVRGDECSIVEVKSSTEVKDIYVVSLYQMAAKEGKYYLICNYDYYDDISNYWVDRIIDIEIFDVKAKPVELREQIKKELRKGYEAYKD